MEQILFIAYEYMRLGKTSLQIFMFAKNPALTDEGNNSTAVRNS